MRIAFISSAVLAIAVIWAPTVAATQPATTQPATTQPATVQPATVQPVTAQPATAQPSSGQDGAPTPDAEPAAGSDAPTSGEWGFGDPYSLDLGVMLGTSRRLDDPPLYRTTTRQGLTFGAGLDLFVSRRVSVGLGYEHLDLGAEDSGVVDGGAVTLTRDLNSLWTSFRLYPLRGDTVAGFMRLGLAAVWQSADARGSLWSPTEPGRSLSFRCEGGGSLDFAFRAALGADVALGGGTRFLGSGGIDYYRLSDSVLGGCAPGAGTSLVLGLRAGFVYGMPL